MCNNKKDKYVVVRELLYSNENEQIIVAYNSVDGSHKHNIKQEKQNCDSIYTKKQA